MEYFPIADRDLALFTAGANAQHRVVHIPAELQNSCGDDVDALAKADICSALQARSD